MLTVALLALFAVVLAQSQHRQRRDVEKRFHDRAAVSAALTEAIFSVSATQTQAQNALRFGGPTVSQAQVDRSRQSQALYLAIVAEGGRVLAATPSTPPRVATSPPVKHALGQGRTELSDLLPGPGSTKIIDFVIPFRARSGPRVQVSGTPQRLLGQFLGGFLGQVPNVADASSYVVDGRGLVIGSTGAKATVAMSGPVALAETEIHWVFCFRGAKVALAAGFERRDEALRTLRERCAA